MSKITIKTEDYEVTAESALEATRAIVALEDTTDLPTAQRLDGGEVSVPDLVAAWEQKAACSDYSQRERAAYCDAAETLSVVLKGGTLTESP